MSDEQQTTSSGLKYKIIREGDADSKPTAASTVRAHYKGWLDDGKVLQFLRSWPTG